jgi:hypothetical protein
MSSDRFDQGIREFEFERDGLVTLPGYIEATEQYDANAPKRWFSMYRSRFYKEKGRIMERTMGGRVMRCYHDLATVRHVARKWMAPVPDAKAFIFEVFALEGDPPLGFVPSGRVAEEPHASGLDVRRSWRWYKPQRKTRLVFLEELCHPEVRIVELTEKLMANALQRYRAQQMREGQAFLAQQSMIRKK